MRIARCMVLTVVVSVLTACASQSQSPTQMAANFLNQQRVIPTSNAEYPAKDPQMVALFQDSNSPHAPYRVIGMASISRYNLLGMERSSATMQTMLKRLAANMGGDGLINISHSPNDMKAHVIAYQKILI